MDSTFTLMGTPVSLLELLGAAIGIVYLYLEYRANRWLWLFGALMPLLYICINFENGFYANGALNIYYLVISIYGAVAWLRTKGSAAGAEETRLCSLPRRRIVPVVLVSMVLSVSLSLLLRLSEESEMAWLDGITAALGVVGMWLMTQKYYQQWLCWIIVNPLLLAMYLLHGNYPSALLYAAYSVVAVMGYRRWRNLYRSTLKENEKQCQTKTITTRW